VGKVHVGEFQTFDWAKIPRVHAIWLHEVRVNISSFVNDPSFFRFA